MSPKSVAGFGQLGPGLGPSPSQTTAGREEEAAGSSEPGHAYPSAVVQVSITPPVPLAPSPAPPVAGPASLGVVWGPGSAHLWLRSGMFSTEGKMASAILRALQLGERSTSTAMDSSRCSSSTTLHQGCQSGGQGGAAVGSCAPLP